MDFGIRELLMLTGILILIAVIIDGVRRFQENRKNQLKVVKKKKHVDEVDDADDDLDWYSGELPLGKARVRGEQANHIEESNAPYEKKIMPRFEPIDILMENNSATKAARVNTDNTFEELSDTQENIAQANIETENKQASVERVAVETKAVYTHIESNFDDEVEGILSAPRVRAKTSSEQTQVATTQARQERNTETNTERKKEQSISRFSIKAPSINQGELFVSEDEKEEEVVANDLPEEVLSVNVIAKRGQEISGQDLLVAVQSFGLRFGDMNIFHRHEHSTGQGPVIFSMANAINPGTFDIEKLPEMHVKGVTFFMRLSEVNKRIFVLELMVDIAKRLANQLGAELKDDTHSVLSSQTVTHYKSRIQEYERRYLGQVLRK